VATKIGLQFGQMKLNDLPDDLMIDRRIAVDQNIPEADGPLDVGNSRRQDGIEAPQSGQRFAYNFKLAISSWRSIALLSMSSAR
jgi:hypothetical protein